MQDRNWGTITLIGSGEMAESMSRVHRTVLSRIDGDVHAAFLDTPAGFELNADEISAKAVEYFEQRFSVPLEVASFKNKERATAVETEAALRRLRRANYIFAGPGSPSYAIRNWEGTPVWDTMLARFREGTHLVFASAAAITTGCCALPVYEIYKAGMDPFWMQGLDLFGQLGLEVAVIPHWNNSEGGTFDTRFCFMGAPRLELLERSLAPSTVILGIDEYTACIVDPAAEQCTVMGAGRVTVRHRGNEWTFQAGENFGLERLRAATERGAETAPAAPDEKPDSDGYTPPDTSTETGRYLHQLAHALAEGQTADMQRDLIEQVHETVHELTAGWQPEQAGVENAAPYIHLLVEMRSRLRAGRHFALADEIRRALSGLGVEIKDTPDGPVWSRVESEAGGRAGGDSEPG